MALSTKKRKAMKPRRKNRSNAREYAFRLLKVRARSKEELKRRLETKGYSLEEIDGVMEELQKADLINDEKFSVLFAYDQLEFHVKGPHYVRYKLRALGVEEELIERAVKKTFKEDDVKRVIERFVKEHCRKSRDDIFKMLVRRGFDTKMVHEILLAIYEDWRCVKNEPGNNDNFDIRSSGDTGGDTRLPFGKNERIERTKKSERECSRNIEKSGTRSSKDEKRNDFGSETGNIFDKE